METSEPGVPETRHRRLPEAKIKRIAYRVAAEALQRAVRDGVLPGIENFPDEHEEIVNSVVNLAKNLNFKSI